MTHLEIAFGYKNNPDIEAERNKKAKIIESSLLNRRPINRPSNVAISLQMMRNKDEKIEDPTESPSSPLKKFEKSLEFR
jgi:hypothetical protein